MQMRRIESFDRMVIPYFFFAASSAAFSARVALSAFAMDDFPSWQAYSNN
jgi:hypothetical protein